MVKSEKQRPNCHPPPSTVNISYLIEVLNPARGPYQMKDQRYMGLTPVYTTRVDRRGIPFRNSPCTRIRIKVLL